MQGWWGSSRRCRSCARAAWQCLLALVQRWQGRHEWLQMEVVVALQSPAVVQVQVGPPASAALRQACRRG